MRKEAKFGRTKAFFEAAKRNPHIALGALAGAAVGSGAQELTSKSELIKDQRENSLGFRRAKRMWKRKGIEPGTSEFDRKRNEFHRRTTNIGHALSLPGNMILGAGIAALPGLMKSHSLKNYSGHRAALKGMSLEKKRKLLGISGKETTKMEVRRKLRSKLDKFQEKTPESQLMKRKINEVWGSVLKSDWYEKLGHQNFFRGFHEKAASLQK